MAESPAQDREHRLAVPASANDVAQEVDHEGVMWLLNFGSSAFLCHSGTGEVARLPGQEGTIAVWKLFFHGSLGALQQLDHDGLVVQELWCNEILDKSLHEAPRASDGSSQASSEQFIQVKGGGSQWVSEASAQAKPKALTLSGGTHGLDAKLEAYHHDIPKGSLQCPCWVMWCVGALTTELYGPKAGAKDFSAKRLNRWQAKVEWMLGASVAAHIRRSSRSVCSRAKEAGMPAPSQALSNEEDASLSTFVLVLVLASYSLPKSREECALGPQGTPNNVRVMHAMAQMFLAGEFHWTGCHESTIKVRDGTVLLSEWSNPEHLKPHFWSKAWPDGVPDTMAFEDLASHLASLTATQGRITSVRRIGFMMLEELAHMAHWLVNASVSGDAWSASSYLTTLAPIKGISGKRPRRIPSHFKLQLAEAMDSMQTKVTMAQGLQAAQSLANLNALKHLVNPRSIHRWAKVRLHNYWLSIRASFSSVLSGAPLQLGVAMDGMRVGGREVLNSCLWDMNQEQGCWMPPQAPWLQGAMPELL